MCERDPYCTGVSVDMTTGRAALCGCRPPTVADQAPIQDGRWRESIDGAHMHVDQCYRAGIRDALRAVEIAALETTAAGQTPDPLAIVAALRQIPT